MSKKTLFILFCAIISINSACSSSSSTNTNASNSANVMTNLDPKNMPPGLSGEPVPPSSNTTPGIPNPANSNITKGKTPIPGIPDNPGKPLPKGATPTPGIPADPMNANRQMNSTGTSSTQPANSSGDVRPRTVQKQ